MAISFTSNFLCFSSNIYENVVNINTPKLWHLFSKSHIFREFSCTFYSVTYQAMFSSKNKKRKEFRQKNKFVDFSEIKTFAFIFILYSAYYHLILFYIHRSLILKSCLSRFDVFDKELRKMVSYVEMFSKN